MTLVHPPSRVPRPSKCTYQYEKEHLYPHSCSFTWVYCKYFWESHVDFPPINIQELETFVNNVMD